MNEEFYPPAPSLRTLFISSLWAIFLAILILLIAVLPAEYDIDPTGLGETFGFRQLAIAKKANKARLVQQETHQTPSVAESSISMKELAPETVEAELKQLSSEKMEIWKDSVTLIIPPLKSIEYKFYLHRGQSFDFLWKTNGEALYFDLHGEPKGHSGGKETSFKIATEKQQNGSFTAPFGGEFGWYWENKTRIPVKLELKTRGDYRIVGQL